MEITTSRVYPHARSQVWQALTDSAALEAWLMPNTFELKKGHEFVFTTTPRGGFDGTVHCVLIDFKDHESLSYSWLGGKMNVPTVVEWRLEDHPSGMKLSLRHSGFEGFNGWMIKNLLGLGWKFTLLRKKLANFLAK